MWHDSLRSKALKENGSIDLWAHFYYKGKSFIYIILKVKVSRLPILRRRGSPIRHSH